MGRYNFTSPGAMAGKAIEDFLLQRQQLERQAQLDAFTQQQQQEQSARATQQVALQQQQEQRMREQMAQADADRDEARKNTEAERQFRKATTVATVGLPGVIDQDTAGLLQGQGYGTLVKQGQPTQGAYKGDDEGGVPQYDVTPGIMQFAGGTQYQQARSAESARAGEAEKNRQAAEERASADRQTREMIAGMAASGRGETTDLRNQLLQQQIDAATDKKTDKAAADKRSKDAARVTAGSTLDVLKQLADFTPDGKATLKPGVGQQFGMRMPGISAIPGTRFADASAALERLKGRVIVDLLNEMKNQSRTGATGFGSLNKGELDVIQNASSQLNSSGISDVRAAEEMRRIYDTVTSLYDASAGGGVAGGRVNVIAPNGTPGTLPAEQLQQALAQGYKQAP